MRKVVVKHLDESYYEERVPIKFTIHFLNAVLAYILSDSPLITRGSLTNVRKLFNMLDMRIYSNDYLLEARIKFIVNALEAKLDSYMEDPKLILESCRSERHSDVDDEIIDDVMEMNLKTTEIKYISNVISDKLTYGFIYKYKDEFVDLISKLESGDYDSLKKLNKRFKKQVTELMNEIRRAEHLETSDTMFSLTNDVFESVVTKTVNKLSSPNSILGTGIQKLNEILSGGFEAGRFYMFLGASGDYKSGILLTMLYHIKMYNKKYKAKDPLKRPTVLLITQENQLDETIDRLYSMINDDGTSLKNVSPKEAIKIMRNKGRLTLNADNNIDIVIMFKPGKSIDTGDLYTIIDDLEESGCEIICLIHDYIKRIRSVQKTADLRLELGFIVDEMKTLAMEKDIPVISASQLNREAVKTIEMALEANRTDQAKLLGSSNVGESWNMVENSDWVCVIHREMKKSTGQMYLSFNRVKIRFKPLSDLKYFNHPFALENQMRLVADVDGECASELSFENEFGVAPNASNNNFGRKNAKKRDTITFTPDNAITPESLGNLLFGEDGAA